MVAPSPGAQSPEQQTRRAPGKGSAGRAVRHLGFVPALDGVRGVAVLIVVTGHALQLLLAKPTWLRGTFLGVDLFFVLSGFLITSLLLSDETRSGRIRLVAFYRRRALRLLPALYAMLIVHVVYAAITKVQGDEQGTITSIVFYYQNYSHKLQVAEGLGHLWSLAIEEQFYLVWPLLLMLFAGMRRRISTSVAFVSVAVVVVAVRRAWMWKHGGVGLWMYMATDTRADSLLVGALAAQLWTRGRVPRKGLVPIAWAGVGLVAFCVWRLDLLSDFYFLGGYTLIAIAFAAGLLAALETPWSATRFLQLRPLRAVGRVSYGLYLWHLFVFFVVFRYGTTWHPLSRLAVGVGVSAAVTYLSYRFVERPFLRWKDRLEHKEPVPGRVSGTPVARKA